MSQSSLEQVKELAQQLTPDDRKELFNFLATLSDGGIAFENIDPLLFLSPENRKKVEESLTHSKAVPIRTKTHVTIVLRGRSVFTLVFYPENFRQSRREVSSWRDAEPTEDVKEQARRAIQFLTQGKREVTEAEIIAAVKRTNVENFEGQNFAFSEMICRSLSRMAWVLYEGGSVVFTLAHQNHMAVLNGQRKQTLEEMLPHLEPFWKWIKTILNATPGGPRNVKHTWAPLDPFCLNANYERLKPIWREAKRAAKQAQESKEANRRKRWKEATAAIYASEDLPADLIDRLELPQATPPSELALLHAARICIPGVNYSIKALKEKLLSFKRLFRTDPKQSQNEGSS